MKKIDLGQTMTILANLAVLAGLVALVVEIRTNSAAVQAAAVQESVNSTREYLLNIALDEDLSRIRQSGEENIEGLSEQEAFRFQLQSRGNWLYLQNLWIQRGLGILNDSAWASVERIICTDLLAKPGWRQDWQNHRSVLDPQFVARAEGCSGLN